MERGERHHRRPIRMKGYDYTGDGAYFITICIHGRIHVFGAIVNGEMRFNEYGREVANCWSWLAERYPYVHLDQWVVMPDHMHAIIVITDDRGGGAGSNVTGSYGMRRGDSRAASTTSTALTGSVDQPQVRVDGGGIVRTNRKSLGRLIGAFKTVSTRRVNDIRSTPGAKLWQRNYYEHIIRDGRSLRCIREYIGSNPSRQEKTAGTQR
ncbi:MAG TPA: transposase [Rubrobacter sp.]|nr:transposase [Rubrobacter sp.]